MPDPKLGPMLLPSPTLEGSDKRGKENLSFPEQETETAQTCLDGGADACVCSCLLSLEHLLLRK